MIFFTADWHLGEDRFEIMNRPFKSPQEMIDKLIENHNKLVSVNDTVYVIGDVVYQKTPAFLPLVKRFNGTKILIRGNHDRVFSDDELLEYFVSVVPEDKGMLFHDLGFYLIHYPTLGVKDKFNLVGHVHGAWRYQLNMLNVGVDTNHFYPYTLEQVKNHFYAIQHYYDEDFWVAYERSNMAYLNLRGKKGSYADQLKPNF